MQSTDNPFRYILRFSFTVIAFNPRWVLADNNEFTYHGFTSIGDASGIGTANNANDFVRDLNIMFFYYLITTDNIDSCFWGNQCYFINLMMIKFPVFHFNNVLFP